MKTHPAKLKGFTLIELLVSMTITTLIITVLVSITNIARDSWTRSRDEIRTSRLAREALTIMADDLETMIVREGNTFQWFHAEQDTESLTANTRPTNAVNLLFFSSPTDSYDPGVTDEGGNISLVAYKLDFRDPIETGGARGKFPTYALYRDRVNPKDTFDDLLAQDDLETAFTPYESNWTDSENFLVENVFSLTATFTVEFTRTAGAMTTTEHQKITLASAGSGDSQQELKIYGDRIESSTPNPELDAGQIIGMELSITVLTESGVQQLRDPNNENGKSLEGERLTRFLERNSFQYSQSISIPRR